MGFVDALQPSQTLHAFLLASSPSSIFAFIKIINTSHVIAPMTYYLIWIFCIEKLLLHKKQKRHWPLSTFCDQFSQDLVSELSRINLYQHQFIDFHVILLVKISHVDLCRPVMIHFHALLLVKYHMSSSVNLLSFIFTCFCQWIIIYWPLSTSCGSFSRAFVSEISHVELYRPLSTSCDSFPRAFVSKKHISTSVNVLWLIFTCFC